MPFFHARVSMLTRAGYGWLFGCIPKKRDGIQNSLYCRFMRQRFYVHHQPWKTQYVYILNVYYWRILLASALEIVMSWNIDRPPSPSTLLQLDGFVSPFSNPLANPSTPATAHSFTSPAAAQIFIYVLCTINNSSTQDQDQIHMVHLQFLLTLPWISHYGRRLITFCVYTINTKPIKHD